MPQNSTLQTASSYTCQEVRLPEDLILLSLAVEAFVAGNSWEDVPAQLAKLNENALRTAELGSKEWKSYLFK